MKILFVVNNFYASGNGLSASARRTAGFLEKAGDEVKVLSGPNPDPDGPRPDFQLKTFSVPVFDGIIKAHGYKFAKSDKEIIRRAVEWADVVHLEEAFYIQYLSARSAKKLGKPCTATYHLHPENLFCSLHLGWWKFLNHGLLGLWRDLVFNYCSDIQCPTQNVLDRLRRFHFKSRLHLISNGIIPDESIRRPQAVQQSPFVVVCIGRYAVEKDPFTLLNAMRHSRHANDIQLIFSGRGPEADKLKAKADKICRELQLTHKPAFVFSDRNYLRELAATADLYVHCAKVEVEGLSALEALQQGIVPVIASGRLTATSQFALDERSLFPAGDPVALAARIDYWYEHQEERALMGPRYAESTKAYDIDLSVSALRAMFVRAAGEKS